VCEGPDRKAESWNLATPLSQHLLTKKKCCGSREGGGSQQRAVITAAQLGGPQQAPLVKLRPLFWDKVPVTVVPTSVWGRMASPGIVPEQQLRVMERLFPQAAPATAKKKQADKPG